MHADASERHVVLEELAVGRGARVVLREQQDPSDGMAAARARRNAHAGASAPRRRPFLLLRELGIHACHEAERTRGAGVHLDSAVHEHPVDGVGLAPEEMLATAIHAQHPDRLREHDFERFERQVLAFDLLIAEQILVAEM